MALSGANLAPFSAIWRHLAPLGATWRHLFGTKRNGATWRQMAPIIQNLGKSPIGANFVLGQSPIGACAMIDSLFLNLLVDESLPNI